MADRPCTYNCQHVTVLDTGADEAENGHEQNEHAQSDEKYGGRAKQIRIIRHDEVDHFEDALVD